MFILFCRNISLYKTISSYMMLNYHQRREYRFSQNMLTIFRDTNRWKVELECSHIKFNTKCLYKVTGIVYKTRKLLPKKALWNIYNALFHSKLIFLIAVHGAIKKNSSESFIQFTKKNTWINASLTIPYIKTFLRFSQLQPHFPQKKSIWGLHRVF